MLRNPDPTRLKDLKLSVPLRWSVKELKRLISIEHPQRPPPSQQVLIHCGKVLSDGEAPLAKVLQHPELEGPYTLHLAIRNEESLTQSASAPNLGEVNAAPRNTTEMPTTSAPVVALPIVMMNPIVSAAYNAALAAVYNPNAGSSQTTPSAVLQPPSLRENTTGTTSAQPNVPNANQPMVPAIAFFPLGIPVLVPAAAQNQGFQIGQTAAPPPVQSQFRQPPNQPRNVQRRPAFQQIGRRPLHGGNPPHVRGRGVVVYRFSLRGLIQLALIVAVLYAYCSRERFIFFVTMFILLYLFARPIRRMIHNFYNARDADGRRRPRGILHEILAIVLTLISSLFPNWNLNEGQGVPFARVVREEIPVENRDVPHPHAD